MARSAPRPRSRPLALLLACALVSPAVAANDKGADRPARHDVVLHDASLERALELLAELYGLSFAVGPLPETSRVTLQLHDADADTVLDALAAVSGLRLVRRGAVIHVLGPGEQPPATRTVRGPFPPQLDAILASIRAAGVRATRLGPDVVLLSGPPAELEAAEAALTGARPQTAGLEDRLFPLGLADAEQALALLRPLLDTAAGESMRHDPARNRLLVTARPATLARIEALLTPLRAGPAQVEIEAKVLEVSTDELRRLGAEWRMRLGLRGGSIPTSFPFRTTSDAQRFLPSPNDIRDLLVVGNTVQTLNRTSVFVDPGLSFARFDMTGVELFVEFLETHGLARVLARPRITTLDNHEATIRIATTVRVPTFTINQAFSTETVTGIEEIDAGVRLQVRPRVGDDGEVLLSVSPTVSDITGDTGGFPTVSTREARTEVVLRSGETLVIGGLQSERERTSETGIPGLKDLPLVGAAFRSKQVNRQKVDLMIFLTPRVLPSPAERRHMRLVEGRWLPRSFADRHDAAIAELASDEPERRAGAVARLERLAARLERHGLDPEPRVRALSDDPALAVRVAAARYLLRRHPDGALEQLRTFRQPVQTAAAVLAEPISPAQRDAIAALLAASDGGPQALEAAFERERSRRPPNATRLARLLTALADVAPERAAERARPHADAAHPPLATAAYRALARRADEQALAVLALHAATDPEPERRTAAATALLEAVGLRRATALVQVVLGRTGRVLPRARLAALERLAANRAALPPPEPALAWLASPDPVRFTGAPTDRARGQAALRTLERHAPDLAHLVRAALRELRLEPGGVHETVAPFERRAQVGTAGLDTEHLAHRLVQLAARVYAARRYRLPPDSAAALAFATRLELHAVERLSGTPIDPAVADRTVREIIETLRPGETAR